MFIFMDTTVTGQQLFKPRIGKSPIGMRHENVSEKLYSSSKIVEEAQRKQKVRQFRNFFFLGGKEDSASEVQLHSL